MENTEVVIAQTLDVVSQGDAPEIELYREHGKQEIQLTTKCDCGETEAYIRLTKEQAQMLAVALLDTTGEME